MPLTAVRGGDHVCLTTSAVDAQVELVAGYLWQSMVRGNQALYLADDGLGDRVQRRLEREGAEVRRLKATGQLIVGDARTTYSPGGRFRPDGMFELFAETADRAVRDGWAGLRVWGDTAWVTEVASTPLFEEFMAYESTVTSVLRQAGAAAICHYRSMDLRGSLGERVLHVHPSELVRRRPRRAAAGGLVVEETASGTVRISGEADRFNLQLLCDALVRGEQAGGDLYLDLSKLDFADVAAVRALCEAARALALRGREAVLVGAGPRLTRISSLLGLCELSFRPLPGNSS